MRIAQVANFVSEQSGGMKTAISHLGSGYVEAGVERLLVVPGPCDAITTTENGDVVQVRAPKVGDTYRLIVEPWRVVEILQRFQPRSIEWSDKLTLMPVAWWARRNAIHTVLLSHERLDDMFAMRAARGRTSVATATKASIAVLNRVVVRSFDTIVVTSRYAQAEFCRVAQVVGCPVVRVPLGVDLDVFRPYAHTPSDVLRLVHVGRLSREKSPHLAVATAAELHARGVRVRLDVFGQGPHRNELEELAGQADVRFQGHVASRTELARQISAADVALSACPGETFGLAVLEALACGTPVVTASRGGARELIGRRSGAWGEPNPASLADAVLTVAGRPVASSRAAARARAEQFTWSQTVAQMLAVHSIDAPLSRLPKRPHDHRHPAR